MDGQQRVVRGETIVEAFLDNVGGLPDRPALRRRVADGWETLTWADYGQAVSEVLSGLIELGIRPGEHVGIISNNRVEWHLADIATLCNGSVTVPVYPTSYPPQVAHVLGHGDVRVCFAEDDEQVAKILEVRDELPTLDRIVAFEHESDVDEPFVVSLADLRSMGRTRLESEPDLLAARVAGVTPDQLATLVYTSGTTGPPKGTMITHRNIVWTLRQATVAIEIHERERLISFLPLSHIAERMMSDFLPIGYGGETWFARSLATVAEDLPDCRPTIFFAVPRVWEKLHDKVVAKLDEEKGLKKRLIGAYVSLGLRKVALEQDGTPMPPFGTQRWRLLDRVIGTKIRHTLGLDQTHVMITAAAPIHPDVLRWYHAVGLPVQELYGQTEDCGPTSTNTPAHCRIGSVGQPWPGDTVRIADDGEILVKGGNVCLGYYKDEAGTAALIDADGFMHSGDIGQLDGDGYLYITGRKKDLIITASGKNISPQELETDLRFHPLISQAVVVGEGRRYLTVLVTLDPDEADQWAAKRGKPRDGEALARDPDLLAEVQSAIDEVNGKRSHAESIRKFRVLPRDLSAADGELTPTLKVKRNVVYEHNATVVEEMYTDATA
jgi:long-chain acyl-CoA synthetase